MQLQLNKYDIYLGNKTAVRRICKKRLWCHVFFQCEVSLKINRNECWFLCRPVWLERPKVFAQTYSLLKAWNVLSEARSVPALHQILSNFSVIYIYFSWFCNHFFMIPFSIPTVYPTQLFQDYKLTWPPYRVCRWTAWHRCLMCTAKAWIYVFLELRELWLPSSTPFKLRLSGLSLRPTSTIRFLSSSWTVLLPTWEMWGTRKPSSCWASSSSYPLTD